ncbi:MAG: HAD family hydrolase [Streptosporangiaceae bacterium]
MSQAGKPRPLPLPPGPTIGFDLDLTLIDTGEATAHALGAVARELDLVIDLDQVLADRGPAFREVIAGHVPGPLLATVLHRFYRVFLAESIGLVRVIDGASETLDRLRVVGGRSVIITGRRELSARCCLDVLGLRVDEVCGGVSGPAKAPAMTEQGVHAFVGDHALDMMGARMAGVPGVGVLSGGHDPVSLRAAGAVAVVTSVAALPPWFR